MTHSIHREGVVLDDDCPVCIERSERLNSLDRSTLLWLVKVSESGYFGQTPTHAEQAAQSLMWHALLVMERLTGRDWRDVLGRNVVAEAMEQEDPRYA